MSETIRSIVAFVGEQWAGVDRRIERFDGWRIVTDQQWITLGIRCNQRCCEEWGYFLSEDDPSLFVGAGLCDVRITDTELRAYANATYTQTSDDVWYQGDVLFVDIVTDCGTLQFVAYNRHNGAYGHDAIVRSIQCTHTVEL